MKFLILPIFAFLLFFSFWEMGVRIFHIEQWILPSPLQILASLWIRRELLLFHTSQTILEALMGLSFAVLVGAGIAIIMEWSAFFQRLLKPFLVVSQTIPFIALAPLLVIWFGYGLLPKILVIILACFFPIAVNLYDGFKSVDVNMIRLLKSMDASKWQIFRLVKFPSSLPYFFSGLKIAGAYAVTAGVVSEWLGAEGGLGILLVRFAKSYLTDGVFAVIFVITALSLVLVFTIEQLTKITIPWHYHKKERSLA